MTDKVLVDRADLEAVLDVEHGPWEHQARQRLRAALAPEPETIETMWGPFDLEVKSTIHANDPRLASLLRDPSSLPVKILPPFRSETIGEPEALDERIALARDVAKAIDRALDEPHLNATLAATAAAIDATYNAGRLVPEAGQAFTAWERDEMERVLWMLRRDNQARGVSTEGVDRLLDALGAVR